MSLALAAIAVMTLSTPVPQDYESPETVISNMRQAAALATQWSTMWLAEPQRSCASATVRRAESISVEITRTAVSSAAMLNDPAVGSTFKWWASSVLGGVAPIAAQSRLDLGNAYLRGGCLNDADRVFREVMTTFTGPQYQSLARVGIDDVREARRVATALPATPVTTSP